MKRTYAILGAGLVVFVCGNVFATADKHPNLTKADRLVGQANAAITAAQTANEFDLGGHAAKAKADLDDAVTELAAARQAANEHDGDKK